MQKPKHTRLRWVASSDKKLIVEWCNTLGARIEIKGCPQWDGKAWVLWFVPDDNGPDIPSGNLTKGQKRV